MSKEIAVVFTPTNARVLINPPNLADLVSSGECILNPDMTYVKQVPPHFWKYESGCIVPMTAEEQALRLDYIRQNGVDNTICTKTLIKGDPTPNLNKIMEELKKRLSEEIEIGLTVQNKYKLLVAKNEDLEIKYDATKKIKEHLKKLSEDQDKKIKALIKDRDCFKSAFFSSIALLVLLTIAMGLYYYFGRIYG